MLATLALTACLVGWLLPEDVSKPDMAAYETAKAKAGRSASEHVKLALWCEAHGMSAERMKHLAIAVLNDPKQATARGLLGLVEYGGKWKRPEAVSDSVKANDKLNNALAEYNERRSKTPNTAEAQWKLAVWCDQNGLKAEAIAHLTAVTRLDPNHEHAWKRLGFKKAGNRWVTDGQVTAERAEYDVQKKADKSWFKQLVRLRANLADPKKQAEAEKSLQAATDPRAVPAIWIVFAQGTEADQKQALNLLGKIETGDSSQALAMLSIQSGSPEVRRRAAEALKRRDPRDYIGWMISLIRDELKYEVKPVGGPGSPGVLFVQGERYNIRRSYNPPALPNITLFAGEPITYDGDGLPVVTRLLGMGKQVDVDREQLSEYRISYNELAGRKPLDPTRAALVKEARAEGNITLSPGLVIKNAEIGIIGTARTTTSTTPTQTTLQIPIGRIMMEYEQAALASEADLEADIASVDRENVAIREQNNRVAQVLRNVSGHDEGTDREAWKAWSTDRQGYAYKPTPEVARPTIDEDVPSSYIIPPMRLRANTVSTGDTITSTSTSTSGGSAHACFKAGTTVKTLTGDRPIELIEIGDELLTQETTNGALSYQPALTVFHNPPSLTYKIELDSESISATGIHRFWKAGQGWVMARDLKAGDKIRTLNGPGEVKSVEPESTVPVFNLEVASGHSFFVGKAGALVHDNSLVRPVYQAFDREPELTGSTGAR